VSDPVIPERGPSTTPSDKTIPFETLFLNEVRNACAQMQFVRRLLEKLKTIAEIQSNVEE